MQQLSINDLELAFVHVPERERTKHVHRLHPYLGKFIPQLVEYFLSRYFQPGQLVIDPFCGSGTTLVQAAELGINSIGIDVSEFNVMIARVKLDDYDLKKVEKEVRDITERTVAFSRSVFDKKQALFGEDNPDLATQSSYLKTWFAERSLKEILYFKSIISEYEYQDLLKVLLSRTARSCRLIYHYELATQSKPITEPYVCYKHKGKICAPVVSIIPRLNFYSKDTIRRLRSFSELRNRHVRSMVLEGDSRTIELAFEAGQNWKQLDALLSKGAGIFTSPPYLGQIDYHDQHLYAYELFGLKRMDSSEIGAKKSGKGEKARLRYVEEISKVLLNMRKYLPEKSNWFVVANDKLQLYPQIFERAGVSIIKTYNRPVEDRTERDKRPYSESIFLVN